MLNKRNGQRGPLANLAGLLQMNVMRGLDGRLYAVFDTMDDAERWAWLFSRILRRPMSRYGGYSNAYMLF
jgi:hypothetical protein